LQKFVNSHQPRLINTPGTANMSGYRAATSWYFRGGAKLS